MIVYSCDKLGISFSGEAILENINIAINEKDRIGIVGDNGAGKTTFIKLLTGELLPLLIADLIQFPQTRPKQI